MLKSATAGLEITAVAVGGRRGRRRASRAVESGAGDLARPAGAERGLQRLRARVEVDISGRRREPFRRGVVDRAERRQILALHRRDARDLDRFVGDALQRVGAGIVAGDRAAPAPTHTVAVMSRSVGAPAGGDAVVGKARVRLDRALQRHHRVISARALRVRQHAFADLQGVVAVSITAPPCSGR